MRRERDDPWARARDIVIMAALLFQCWCAVKILEVLGRLIEVIAVRWR